MMVVPRLAPLLLIGLLLVPEPAAARVYMTVERALQTVFPPPQRTERRTLYLDDERVRRAEDASGVRVEARVVSYYVGESDGRVSGYAYLDTHLVRTLPETVMVVVAPEGALLRIDVLSFDEPEDYLPTSRWLQQFEGRSLQDLGAGRGIRTLTGATLSSRAVTQAARRVLALHRLFVAPPPPTPEKPSAGRP
jgi:Na+-translocating ferredoxin:NAD+ oxidoreductase RnfG subunit